MKINKHNEHNEHDENNENKSYATEPMRQSMDAYAYDEDFALIEDVSFVSEGGNEYKILMEGFVARGGESFIYKAERVEDRKMFAAKIYTKTNINRTALEAHREICKFIIEHSDSSEYHLMPMYDYGTATIAIDAKVNSTYMIEIMPLVDGGTVDLGGEGKIFFDRLRKKVIPQMVVALETLHNAGIVHRDIKPENFIYYGDNLVLGDFGIAGVLQINDRRAYISTTEGKGTPGYSAPEVAGQVVRKESDLYSLGCTIAALYHGKYYYPELQEEGNNHKIMDGLDDCVRKNKLPFEILPEDKKLKELILGLVQYVYKDRYTLDDVRNFCEYDNWQPPRRTIRQDFEFHFNEQVYHSREDLANALGAEGNWDAAKKEFYTGGVKGSMLMIDIAKGDIQLGKFAQNILLEIEKDDGKKDLGLAKLIHHLNPNHHIFWRGVMYENIIELCNELSTNSRVDAERLITILKSGFLSWKFKDLASHADEKDAEHLSEISKKLENFEGIATRSSRLEMIAYYSTLYIFAGKEALGKIGLNSYDPQAPFNATEYFASIIPNNGSACERALALLEDDAKLAWLQLHGADAETLKLEATKGAVANLQMIFRFFESIEGCNASNVRKVYIDYGPFSYITWTRLHIEYYQFDSFTVKIKEGLLAGTLDAEKSTIEALSEQFAQLKNYYQNLMGNAGLNLLSAYLGIGKKAHDKAVTATDINAFFTEQFYGEDVSIGFMRYINDIQLEN